MDEEPTSLEWRIRSMTVLHRVTTAKRRFSESLGVSDATMLAAADELQVATRDAATWLVADPCPDWRLGAHVAWMLNRCAQVALTAQQAATDPRSDSQGLVGHLGDLLALADLHLQKLDTW